MSSTPRSNSSTDNTPPDASAFDAIIVGGGHNGLAAAAYLAKAGKDGPVAGEA